MSKFAISIVFASYNRPQCLKQSLAAITASGVNIESKIVIDDHSSEENFKLIRKICNMNDFQLCRKKERSGIAKVWNLGIIKSPTRYVIASVDDVILKEDKRWFYLSSELIRLGVHVIYIFKKKCFLIDKEIIPTLGWYDERFPYCGYGDGDFYHRVWTLGSENKLKYFPFLFNPNDSKEETENAFHIPHKISELNEERTWATGDEHRKSREFFRTKWEIDTDATLEKFPGLKKRTTPENFEENITWRAYTVHTISERKIEEKDFYPEVTTKYLEGDFSPHRMKKFFLNL